MEGVDDEDDLKLVKASAGLLSDLETALPKLLWKPSNTGSGHRRVHSQVKRRDLEYVIKLVRLTSRSVESKLTDRNRSNRSKANRNCSMPG